ncbi:MAG TPA: HD domain-containing phosphohydrolase [Candidatus Baltobacteraceae bacterium]|nr:HD domain-containing phosphohydrolase [Candidatus Baltobacteraceae bacterium]
MKDGPTFGQGSGTNDRLLLKQAASLLAADLSLGELFDRLTRMLAEHVDSSVVFIALARPDGKHSIEYFYDHGEVRRYPHIELNEKSRAREVIRTGDVIWGNEVEAWAPGGTAPINKDRPWTNDTVSAIFAPMSVGGTTLGALSVQSARAEAYDSNDVDVISAIAHYLAIAVQNQRMYQALAHTAEYDPLTMLANHSKLARELDAALAESTSTQPFVAVMLNIVNFGMFNETYGYAEGDDVLRRIARTLREFEGADEHLTVGRFGADIFMVLLRDTAPDLANHFVERLANSLSQLAYVARDQTLPISLACGYVVAPFDAGTRGDLTALCVHRTRLSRKQGCVPVGADDVDSYTVHGNFNAVETIVEGLLERDPYTRVHLLQVNSMAKLWSEYNLELDHAELGKLLQASLLHDVGKLLVSDRILVKPGRLTPQEYAAAQQHADFGRKILAQHAGYEEVAEIVGQHHERWDGAGYPSGLAAEAIHPLARAVAILDAFSAMVADRPYHRGVSEDAAMAELERHAGTQFDPALVEKFITWREEGNPPPLA